MLQHSLIWSNTATVHVTCILINYCSKQSVAAETSSSLASDAKPMDANPSYEEVHVYKHIDKKDTKL